MELKVGDKVRIISNKHAMDNDTFSDRYHWLDIGSVGEVVDINYKSSDHSSMIVNGVQCSGVVIEGVSDGNALRQTLLDVHFEKVEDIKVGDKVRIIDASCAILAEPPICYTGNFHTLDIDSIAEIVSIDRDRTIYGAVGVSSECDGDIIRQGLMRHHFEKV